MRGCRKCTEGQYGKVRKDISEKYGKVRKDTCTEKYRRSFAWQIYQTCDKALKIRKNTDVVVFVRIWVPTPKTPQDVANQCVCKCALQDAMSSFNVCMSV